MRIGEGGKEIPREREKEGERLIVKKDTFNGKWLVRARERERLVKKRVKLHQCCVVCLHSLGDIETELRCKI